MSKLQVTIDGHVFVVEAAIGPGNDNTALIVTVDGHPVRVDLSSLEGPEQIQWALVNQRPYDLEIDHDLRWIYSARSRHELQIRDMEAAVARPVSGDGRIKAPIPGLIARVLIEAGQQVEAGQPILVLEAMKMENEIRAPRSGELRSLKVQPGQVVRLHEVLGEIG